MTTTPEAAPALSGGLDDCFHVFDTTLRDGAQREGINLTVADKLTIARHLDDFGVGFIEGGWPGANPRDTEFFARARTEIDFKNARLVAFGATRRAGGSADQDPQVRALLESGAPVITLVAKSHDRHVELALRTTLDENLDMVRDTVSHLVAQGRRVFVDCEHFFDGYRANAEYAKSVVRTAHEAGADVVILCDTNGGMLPARSPRPSPPSSPTPAPASASTPRTTPAAPSPTPWPPWTPAPPTSSAPPTATANASATPTSSPSSPRWRSSTGARSSPRAPSPR